MKATDPTPAGQFNRRLQMMKRDNGSPSTNTLGEKAYTSVSLGTVWAKIRPLTSREIVANAQNTADSTHNIRVRYNADIGHADYLVFGTRIFDILDITTIGEENREISIIAHEQTA